MLRHVALWAGLAGAILVLGVGCALSSSGLGGSASTSSGAGAQAGTATSGSGAAEGGAGAASATGTGAGGLGGTGGNVIAGTGGTGGMGAGGVGAGGGGGLGGTGGAPQPYCGDGTVDANEECDDGNAMSGDGCEACLFVCPTAAQVLDPANHHCYELVSSGQSWMAASTACTALGGYLATITTQAELDFVASSFTITVGGAWIGATDSATEGTFVWVTGEAWGFELWEPNEPSNGGSPSNVPGEDCVETTAGSPHDWNDDSCSKSQPFVCEWTLPL